MAKCAICQDKIVGGDHNAAPVRSGRCCESCNTAHVIPTRMEMVFSGLFGDKGLGFAPVWESLVDPLEHLQYKDSE